MLQSTHHTLYTYTQHHKSSNIIVPGKASRPGEAPIGLLAYHNLCFCVFVFLGIE